MFRKLCLLACLFFLVRPLAAHALPATTPTCPFRYDQKTAEIRVEVMINGKGPFLMKLDTGSTISLVTPAVARAAGIETLARTQPCGAYGGDVSLGSGTIGDLEVGGISLYDQPCLIGDLDNAVPCDGILSGALFDSYAVQIDFAKNSIAFLDSASYQPSPTDACIPFQLGNNHIPVCMGEIDGLPARLAIDTGFDGSLTLLPCFVHDNDLAQRCDKVATVTTYSLEGTRKVGLYSMGRLTVGSGGSARAEDHVLALFDDFPNAGVQYDCDGLLGAQMLAHWTVTLDYAHSRMVLH